MTSRTISLHTQAQLEREQKRSEAPSPPTAQPKPEANPRTGAYKPSFLLTAGFLVLFFLTVTLLFMVMNYAKRTKAALDKIDKIELAWNAHVQDVSEVGTDITADVKMMSADIDDLYLRMKGVSERLTGINNNVDAQVTAIESLTKAKNTLFTRVSALEAQLADLRKWGKR